LERTTRDGAAFVPDLLDDAWCRALLEEVGTWEFAALPAVEGPHRVRQQADHRVFTGADIAALPTVDALRRALTTAVHKHAPAVSGLDAWEPDEVTVQRYEPGSSGISTHLDGRSHPYLVAILTLEGSAPLRLCSDRQGTTLTTWDAVAGSLVLLRGPGLGGVDDGRPLHAVDGPCEHRRTSLTLRARSRR
jgi:hypothetical protein